MASTGCGINHKDTEHTDKCGNNKTKTTQIKQQNHRQILFSKYCKDNTKCLT
jgi:hypothetical protein